MATSQGKWPASLQITKVTSSIIGHELVLYFVAAVMNQTQLNALKRDMLTLAEFALDNDKFAGLSLLSYEQIKQLFEIYEPRSRGWRGQWYALANAVVDGCRVVLE